MIDYSFFRFKNDFSEAKKLGDSPVTEIFYNDFIQLSPNETYLQITNVLGGISFQGNYTADLVDCSNVSVKEINNNIFIEEITDSNGDTQLCLEVVNVNEDFYRETLFIRLSSTISNDVYWSTPLNVTDYELEQTSYFQYKSYDDFLGIPYTNAQKYQSIRLKCYFDIPIDESESQDYYQISKSTTISARTLIKKFERYQCDYINFFVYERLNALLKSDIVYLNCYRVTNKPTLDSDDREGNSNFFTTNFTGAINKNDYLEYSFQIFEGLQVVSYVPFGTYTQDSIEDSGFIEFNAPISLGAGNVYLYNSAGTLLDTQDVNGGDFAIIGNRLVGYNLTGSITVNDGYYFNYDMGIVNFLGIEIEALENNIDWSLTIQDGDFSNTDFNSNDFLTD